MRTLVIYDVSDDRKRKQISDACLDYGLERIQWSAFEGELNTAERQKLAARCRAILGQARNRGEVRFIPICAKDLGQRLVVTRKGRGVYSGGHSCPSARPDDSYQGCRQGRSVRPATAGSTKKLSRGLRSHEKKRSVSGHRWRKLAFRFF